MTLPEIYRNLDPKNGRIDEIILAILSKEKEKPIRRRVYPNMIKEDNLYTICEVIREIFHRTDDIGIQKRCVLAQLYAKKMARKLKYYFDKEGKIKDLNNLFMKKDKG